MIRPRSAAKGPDRGPSYRSAIFAQSPEQAKVARDYIAQLTRAHAFPADHDPDRAGRLLPAEAEHQDFYDRNPMHPYIVRWDKPKVAGFRAGFPISRRRGEHPILPTRRGGTMHSMVEGERPK